KNRRDAAVRWMQLTENDNVGPRYWESLTRSVSHDNPELAEKLRGLGFPETLAGFKRFADIIKISEHHAKKTFLVLDDFHLIRSKQALTFAERCAYLQIPGACVIIISRSEPDINAVSLFSSGKAGIVTEDELRFTQDEIEEFMSQSEISLHAEDISRAAAATEGWALAVKLLSLVLKRNPANLDYALDATRQNTFKLFETEAFNDFSNEAQKDMVRLSLINGLPVTAPGAAAVAGFPQNLPQLSAFMWYDSFHGEYRIHPLYLEFLHSKQKILSAEEQLETYGRAADWCAANNYRTDALNYYLKARRHDKALGALLSFPFKLPRDTCEFVLQILDSQESGLEESAEEVTIKDIFVPLVYSGMEMFDKAAARPKSVIKNNRRLREPSAFYRLYTAHINLAYIGIYTCTQTHDYSFRHHVKKAAGYLKKYRRPPVTIEGQFAVVDVRSFACLVGENASLDEFERFLSAAREACALVSRMYHGMYSGYDLLAACEFAFFKNELEPARAFGHAAILKTREKKQYSIEIMAQYYLLRIAVHEGDYPLTKEILRQINSHLDNKDFWNCRSLCDLFIGSFYMHIGLTDMVPSWISFENTDETSDVHIPVRELIVGVRSLLAAKKYSHALAVLCSATPRKTHERFYFGELIITLLFAVAKLKTGDEKGAAEDFAKAYSSSFSGLLEMPFIELGKAFGPLADILEKTDKNAAIPSEWLSSVRKKASIYAKKTTVIMNSYKNEKNLAETAQLTVREREVLTDLFHGLTREEIAINRYLSINTVKKILQSVYYKLDVKNGIEAVRLAAEKKLFL
ncbi:MAG: LuxR C-terminal-related transcriptional regulator, partial [Defluviitaleaceae bacterium]|nr:LuxR C-terminal-related transcriptional regulator [Defluviitaleaceae bacterium]